jgi:hypothetical protein
LYPDLFEEDRMKFSRPGRFLLGLLMVGSLAATAHAQAPAPASARFVVSADGQDVLDTSTQLTWRRCAEGAQWNGSACKGKPIKFTLAGARKYVGELSAKSPNAAWRIPTKDELLGIVVIGKKAPMIDQASFPNTPSAGFGALRPGFDDNLNGWVVRFRNGHVLGYNGEAKFLLRLVRKAA